MLSMEIENNLTIDAAIRSGVESLRDSLLDIGEAMLGEANKTVPLEEGNLSASGVVTLEGEDTVLISYLAPYAMKQHESLHFRHNPGRRAKWLERTLVEQNDNIIGFMQAAFNEGL